MVLCVEKEKESEREGEKEREESEREKRTANPTTNCIIPQAVFRTVLSH